MQLHREWVLLEGRHHTALVVRPVSAALPLPAVIVVQEVCGVDEHITDGDYVVIRRQETARDGQIVAVRDVDGEATLKRLFREKNRVRLEPANKAMKPIYRDNVEILGVLVGVVRKY